MLDDRTVVGRTFAIIEACLHAHGYPVPLAALTRTTGLPKPTVRRIAEDLVRREWLHRASEGYLTGPALAEAGSRALARHPLTEVLMVGLTDLHHQTGCVLRAVDVSSPRHWPVLYAVEHPAGAALGLATRPVEPDDPAVLATAIGLLALSSHRAAAIRLIERGVPSLTPYTLTQPRQLVAELEAARERGAAVEQQRVVLGWSSVAVGLAAVGGRPTVIVGAAERSHRFHPDRLVSAIRALDARLRSTHVHTRP